MILGLRCCEPVTFLACSTEVGKKLADILSFRKLFATESIFCKYLIDKCQLSPLSVIKSRAPASRNTGKAAPPPPPPRQKSEASMRRRVMLSAMTSSPSANVYGIMMTNEAATILFKRMTVGYAIDRNWQEVCLRNLALP